MRIDSSAPTRLDLAGGTYDIWPLYLFHEQAQTINVAISLRAHCTLTDRADGSVRLMSDDTGESVEADGPARLGVDTLPLLARLARHFEARGVDMRTRSDSPVGAGIAGSSAMNVTVAAALAAWTGRTMSPDELLTLVMNIEAQVINVPTGAQDYRPALFGGLSAVELGVNGVRRTPLGTDLGQLEQRIVLGYTGASRNSGINNWDVMVRRINGDPGVIAAFEGIRDAAGGLRDALERSDWPAVGRHVAAEWEHRKRLAPGVTTPAIDNLLERARQAGASAGKVCGAGGGGCVLCITEPDRRARVAEAVAGSGATLLPFALDSQGLTLVRS